MGRTIPNIWKIKFMFETSKQIWKEPIEVTNWTISFPEGPKWPWEQIGNYMWSPTELGSWQNVPGMYPIPHDFAHSTGPACYAGFLQHELGSSCWLYSGACARLTAPALFSSLHFEQPIMPKFLQYIRHCPTKAGGWLTLPVAWLMKDSSCVGRTMQDTSSIVYSL